MQGGRKVVPNAQTREWFMVTEEKLGVYPWKQGLMRLSLYSLPPYRRSRDMGLWMMTTEPLA